MSTRPPASAVRPARRPQPYDRSRLLGVMTAAARAPALGRVTATAAVATYAADAGLSPTMLRQAEERARHEVFGLRIDVLRRQWARTPQVEVMEELGLAPTLRFVRNTVGRLDTPAVARRYRGLRALPDGTLGREYVRLHDDNRWPLPGEVGGIGEILVCHDMAHVLSGYGVDAIGEVETACFGAGHRDPTPFVFACYVVLHARVDSVIAWHLEHERLPCPTERAVKAIERGAHMCVDLCGEWDHWSVIDVSVAELRAAYGIAQPR